jgi:hypothetical protein
MASLLFRIHNANLAGWRTGSREIVGLKMAVRKDKENSAGFSNALVRAFKRHWTTTTQPKKTP